MDYLRKTLGYYSKWLGDEQILLRDFEEVQYVYSSERNEPQYGYGRAFDLYVFIKNNKIIVSYGDKAKDKIIELKKNLHLGMSANDIRLIISKIFGKDPACNIKYVFSNINPTDDKAMVLKKNIIQNMQTFLKNVILTAVTLIG